MSTTMVVRLADRSVGNPDVLEALALINWIRGRYVF